LGRLLIIAGLLAAAPACTETPDPQAAFRIKLAIDTSAGSFCGSANPSDYGMSCGAQLAIRVDDLELRAPAVNECESVPASESIRGFENINPKTFYNIPPHRVRISVAAWRPRVLPGDLCPAEDIFDERGVPRVDFQPQPAFGGAVFFDVGEGGEEVVVPLSCPDALQLDTEECRGAETTRVQAEVADLETVLPITDGQAEGLDVGVAPPRQIPGLPISEYVIDSEATIELEREPGPEPTFAAEVEVELEGTVCTVVFDPAPAESTASALCRDVGDVDEPIDLPGVLVAKETLDPILTALGLADFPRKGLLIGRVVDHTDTPLAGVSLTPGADGATVQYIDGSEIGGTETSDSGYFVSTDAPFGTLWTAVHNQDGRREEGEPRAGLVRDKVSVVIVRMQRP
jgi:hypothetical protein